MNLRWELHHKHALPAGQTLRSKHAQCIYVANCLFSFSNFFSLGWLPCFRLTHLSYMLTLSIKVQLFLALALGPYQFLKVTDVTDSIFLWFQSQSLIEWNGVELRVAVYHLQQARYLEVVTITNQCMVKHSWWGNGHFLFLFFNLLIYFIYLFLAAVGLRACAQAFSNCGERGLLFVAVCGLLIAVASLVAEHGL